MTAIFENFRLTFDFVIDGIFEVLEGVDVLHLGTGAELLRANRAQGYVDVGAQVAFFHTAVGHINIFHDGLDFFHIGAGFFSRAHIRFGYDFEEGHTSTVVINVTGSGILDGRAGMHELAGIFFHVDTGQADAFLLTFHVNIHPAMFSNRQVVLGRLPVFRQIRIVIVLAVELAVLVDFAVRSKTSLDAELHHPLVYRGQYTGHAQTNRAYMGVLVSTKFRGTTAENLGFRL